MFPYSFFHCSFKAFVRQDFSGTCTSLWCHIYVYVKWNVCMLLEGTPVSLFLLNTSGSWYVVNMALSQRWGIELCVKYKILQILFYSLPLSCLWKSECSALKIVSRCHERKCHSEAAEIHSLECCSPAPTSEGGVSDPGTGILSVLGRSDTQLCRAGSSCCAKKCSPGNSL